MYIRLLTLTVLLLVSIGSLAQGFDENYKAYSGDLNNDGYTDIYISQTPQVILIHGDIITPIVISTPYVEKFILKNNGDGSFTRLSWSSLTSSQRSAASSWTNIAAKLILGDYNADGIIDIFVDLAEEIFSPSIDNMILYASSAEGEPPIALKQVDDAFIQFFNDVYGFMGDPDYFLSGGGQVEYIEKNYTFTDFNALWACGTPEYVPEEPPTPFVWDGTLEEWNTFQAVEFPAHCVSNGWDVYHYRDLVIQYTELVPVYTGVDWSKFAPNMEQFSDNLQTAINEGKLDAETVVSQTIANILESILGVEVMGGVLENSGERLETENEIPESILSNFRFGVLMSSISQSVNSTVDDGEQSRLEIPQLLVLKELLEEVRKTLEAALANKEYDAAAFASGVVDGALSVPNAIGRAYVVVGGGCPRT